MRYGFFKVLFALPTIRIDGRLFNINHKQQKIRVPVFVATDAQITCYRYNGIGIMPGVAYFVKLLPSSGLSIE